MALLGVEYASSEEDSSPSNPMNGITTSGTPIIAAPEVSLDVWSY